MSDSLQGVTSYFYDDASNLKRTVFGNGVVESRSYDRLNRLEFLENKLGDTVISSYDYTLDLVGNRRSVLEDTGRLVEYDYDALYRLTEEKISNDPQGGDRTIGYGYDWVGNREIKEDYVEGVTGYVYDDNDLLRTETLVKDGVTVYSRVYDYDDNGNTVSRVENGTDETRYSWDFENRLVEVVTADGDVITYVYNADGIRVSATVNGVTTEYLVDSNRPYAQVLEEYVDGELIVRYVYGHDLISQQRSGEQSVYQVDGLGSTRVITDEIGEVTDTYNYEAFGSLINSTGGTENKYLFAGEQFDENIEQYYLRNRYYDPSVGRFTRRDTYEGSPEEPASLHKYLYTQANPVNRIDPSGLFSLTEISAANSIRDLLANIQIDVGSVLVDSSLGNDKALDDAILTNLAFAAAFPLIGAFVRGTASAASGLISTGGWLAKHESTATITRGHTIKMHVGKSNSELLHRFSISPTIPAASTFTDRPIAEKVISETIGAYRSEIKAWLKNSSSSPKLILDYVGDTTQPPIGRKILNAPTPPPPIDTHDAIIVLKKHSNPKNGYFILTAYPD